MSFGQVFRRLAGISLLAGLLLADPAGAAEVYRPRYRLAEDLAPVAEAILGSAGRVALDPHGGALVLMGERAAIAEALAAIRALDVRPAVWRVETTLVRSGDLNRAGVRVSGWTSAGDFRIGRAGSLPGGVRVAVGSSEGRQERSFRGEVTVLDGTPAEIWTGSLHARPGGLVPVPTGFRVLPRGRPDGSVELEIASIASESTRHGIAYASSATRVVVRPGETLVLASVGALEADAHSDLLGAGRQSGAQESATLIRVDLVDPDPAGAPASATED